LGFGPVIRPLEDRQHPEINGIAITIPEAAEAAGVVFGEVIQGG
jgi:hypothetical protein